MTTATAAPARSAAVRGGGMLITLLVGAQAMISMDATIVNVALPSIRTDLHFRQADLDWVVNAYALTFGGLLLLGAKLGDTFGRRRMFLIGTTLFTLSSAVAGMAASPGQLIAARAVQGVGAALMSPVAMALILAGFSGARRHRALGLWGAMSGLAGGLGMILGGLLSSASWRWNFYINLPLGVAILIGARIVLSESKVPHRGSPDVAGAIVSTLGLSSLVYGVVGIERYGAGSPVTIGTLAAGVLLLVAFVGIESRAADPVVPLRIFRLRTVSAGNGITALTGALGQITYFTLTLYLQQVQRFSPLASGAAFLPISAAIFLTSTRAAFFLRLIGIRASLRAGLALSGVSLVWLSFVPATRGDYATAVLVPSVLWGLGWGLAQAASFIAPAQDVGAELSGAASGLISTTYRIGGALGLASMSALAAAHTSSLGAVSPATLTAGHAWALRGAVVAAAVGLVLTFLLPRPPATPETERH